MPVFDRRRWFACVLWLTIAFVGTASWLLWQSAVPPLMSAQADEIDASSTDLAATIAASTTSTMTSTASAALSATATPRISATIAPNSATPAPAPTELAPSDPAPVAPTPVPTVATSAIPAATAVPEQPTSAADDPDQATNETTDGIDAADDHSINASASNKKRYYFPMVMSVGRAAPPNQPAAPSQPALPAASCGTPMAAGARGGSGPTLTLDQRKANTGIVNPLRGYYKWGGSETVPVPAPGVDAYQRYTWRELESSPGNYNWSKMDKDLANAVAQGRAFAFRIRAMKGPSSEGAFVPDYLANTQYGWYQGKTFIPDWNNPYVLQRMQALMQALGARYGNNPHIAWVDLGLYGNYGQWSEWHHNFKKMPPTMRPATEATKRAIIDAHIAAFPNTRLLLHLDDAYSLKYGLLEAKPNLPMGLRQDSLGNQALDHLWSKAITALGPNAGVLEERWKTAPYILETFGPGNTDSGLALKQVDRYHISAIGNGNIGSWNSFSSGDKTEFQAAGKRAGYRFSLPRVAVGVSDATLSLTSSWINDGNAPAYEPWCARWQLRRADQSVAWESTSTLDLRTVLPTSGSPREIAESATLNNVAPGTYWLTLTITDPRGVRKPLQLANQTQQSNGSYALGELTIGR